MTFTDVVFLAGAVPIAAAWATLIVSIRRNDRYLGWVSSGCLAVGSWIWFVTDVLEQFRSAAVIQGLIAIWNTYLWWKNRHNRKRRKASRALGAKSRAVIEEMVSKLKPSPIPSPAAAIPVK